MQEILALKPAEPIEAEKPPSIPQAPTQTVAALEPAKPKADDQAVKLAPTTAASPPPKPDAEPAAEAAKKADKPAGDAVVASKPAQDASVKEPAASAREPAAAPVKDVDRVEAMRRETGMLERMTQMAALITHLNGQVNRLESDLVKLAATTEERSADLQRRMALAESNRQMDAATRAQDPRRVEALPVVATKDPKAPVVIKTGPAAAAGAPVETVSEKRSYHIQAASPSLAMLGAGGNDAPLEVVPGSNIPGWGHVSKIEQRGQSWVVVTSGGVIK
ncbi:hypothetical protein [Rhodoblastus acidophilus]|uniref:hypothetical protein n=1 Tax=Rhodoblastus acidophilus TaxID=1074 RepID=UPI002224B745|nr:hypothetical protein [Rhodoblastus acidophilus]